MLTLIHTREGFHSEVIQIGNREKLGEIMMNYEAMQ